MNTGSFGRTTASMIVLALSTLSLFFHGAAPAAQGQTRGSPLPGLLMTLGFFTVVGTVILLIVRAILKRKTGRKLWISSIGLGVVIFSVGAVMPAGLPNVPAASSDSTRTAVPTPTVSVPATMTVTVTATLTPTPTLTLSPKPTVSATLPPATQPITQAATLPNLTMKVIPKGWPSNPVISKTQWDQKSIPQAETVDDKSNGYFVFSICNDSQVNIAQSFTFEYWVDGQRWFNYDIPGLDASGTFQYCGGMGPKPVGLHEIKVLMDTTNRIKESDETDNTFSTTYYVTTAAPPARTVTVNPKGITVKPGDQVQFSAVVTDTRGITVPNQPINWSIIDFWRGADPSIIGTISASGLMKVAADPGISQFRVVAQSGQYIGGTSVNIELPSGGGSSGGGGGGGSGSGYIDIYFSPSRFGTVAIYLDGQGPFQNHVYVNPASTGSHQAVIQFSDGHQEVINGSVPPGGSWVVRYN